MLRYLVARVHTSVTLQIEALWRTLNRIRDPSAYIMNGLFHSSLIFFQMYNRPLAADFHHMHLDYDELMRRRPNSNSRSPVPTTLTLAPTLTRLSLLSRNASVSFLKALTISTSFCRMKPTRCGCILAFLNRKLVVCIFTV